MWRKHFNKQIACMQDESTKDQFFKDFLEKVNYFGVLLENSCYENISSFLKVIELFLICARHCLLLI